MFTPESRSFLEDAPRRSGRTIADLARGQRGRITDVLGHDAVGHRLMEMGMVRGAEVELIRVAPLQDPLELEVRGYLLSIRREEARRFVLEDIAGR
ncbi:MAG: ferrous iron transport protein A [Deltaproteobacteria bacterium]|nr:ferrous iron transport protein A [Deltaproteobacteria bacterium]